MGRFGPDRKTNFLSSFYMRASLFRDSPQLTEHGKEQMNKEKISGIIETTLKKGNKIPGLFELPKILTLKGKLQTSGTTGEVLAIIEDHRGLITKAFGLSDGLLDSAIEQIKSA
jgi:hypothetical protein